MDYDEALDYLLGFTDWRQPVVHRPDAARNLPRMRCLLDLLGEPDRRYPAVVVAGTKGKGSTAALIAACLRAAGHRTGLYSQPHLHDYRERVRVDGVPIDRVALVDHVTALRAAVAQLDIACPGLGQPSTYDLGTALALQHFAARAVDYAVLEVGLGGRFDSVNTVTPRVSAITALSLDHMAVLGTTIEQIAAEKAGIIKPGVPVVAQAQTHYPAAWPVIAATAAERQAPLYRVPDVVRVLPTPGALDSARQQVVVEVAPSFPRASDRGRRFPAVLPLLGHVQRDNAATALAVALLLAAGNEQLDDATLARGLAATRWPGRLEIVRRSPLTLVDGAHNADSAAQLRRALTDLFPGRPLTLILGTSLDKDIAGIVRELAPAAAQVILTVSSHPRSASLARLREELQPLGVSAVETASVGAALDLAAREAHPDTVICATGSLFVVADARAHLGLADDGVV